MAGQWILDEGGRSLVNVGTGVALEAIKDSRDVWVIRFHASAYMADLVIRDGPTAQRDVLAGFDKLVAWIREGADVFELRGVVADEADTPAEPTP
jgi:hypothetical protein